MLRQATFPLLMLLAAVSGCASFPDLSDSLNPLADRPVVADSKNPAVEMACVWQPGEGPGGYGVPARGFSGQVYFFTNRNSEPVLVDGSVRIYLFADRGTPEERAKPLKQFDFGPAAWSAHATMASLGVGYSVFVPYPETAAYQVRCELRARFTPSHGGPPIWSEGVTMVLDGPPRPGNEPASWTNNDRTKSPPTVASYDIEHDRGTLEQLKQRAASEDAKPERSLRTDTFTLGPVRRVSFETSRDGGRSLPRPVPRSTSFPPRTSSEVPEPRTSRPHPFEIEDTSNATLSSSAGASPAPLPTDRLTPRHPLFGLDEAGESPSLSEGVPTRIRLAPASSPPMSNDVEPTAATHPLAG